MYKSTPITKKAGSPLYANESLIKGSAQTNPGFKSYDLKLGKEGKKGKEKTRIYTYDDMRAAGATEAEIEAAKRHNEEKYGTQNPTKEGLANNTTGTGEFEPDEPGTPDEITAFQTKRKAYKDNVGDLENREMNRVIKKAGKDVRRGEVKKAKIENKKAKFETKRGKDIKPGEKGYRKQQRLKAKATETTKELGGFQDRMDNALEGQASGKGLDTRFRSKDVDESQADFTRPEQAERLKMQKTYDASTQTDSQRLGNDAAKLNKFKLTDADTSAGDSFINKYGSGIFMKKSPMKKNYFKK